VPAIWPASLISLAELPSFDGRPAVRLVIAPLSQRTAREELPVTAEYPTIWPDSLMAEAMLPFPPSVPRSVTT
jgi:hypothetical protein